MDTVPTNVGKPWHFPSLTPTSGASSKMKGWARKSLRLIPDFLKHAVSYKRPFSQRPHSSSLRGDPRCSGLEVECLEAPRPIGGAASVLGCGSPVQGKWVAVANGDQATYN